MAKLLRKGSELTIEVEGHRIPVPSWQGSEIELSHLAALSASAFVELKEFIVQNQRLIDIFNNYDHAIDCRGRVAESLGMEEMQILLESDLLETREHQLLTEEIYKAQHKLERAAKASVPIHIYLMRDERTGFYKIGRSKDPQYREKTLQSDNPLITLVHSVLGVMNNEREWHAVFADKRVRGEWFALTQEDVDLFVSTMERGACETH